MLGCAAAVESVKNLPGCCMGCLHLPAACTALLLLLCCACAVVFWGGPIMQVYDFLRTCVRSVSIKALRPATAAEIERMHGDCAICWCEMTVAPCRGSGSSSNLSHSRAAASTAASTAVTEDSTALLQQSSMPAAVAGTVAAASLQRHAGSSADASVLGATAAADAAGYDLADTQTAAVPGQQVEQGDMARVGAAAGQALPGLSSPALHGYTLPCSHAYHQQCLNQVSWLQAASLSCWVVSGYFNHRQLPTRLACKRGDAGTSCIAVLPHSVAKP
jgi:hypothetical protein